MLSAVATAVEGTDEAELTKVLDGVADPLGTFYRFTLANSLLRIRNKALGIGGKTGEGEEAAS